MFQVWMADGDVLNALLGAYPSPSAKKRSASANMFFIDILPVIPSRFRPVSQVSLNFNQKFIILVLVKGPEP